MQLQRLLSVSACSKASLFGFATLFSASSFSHVGHDHGEQTNAFFSGVIHPITGLDHLVALIGFGMLAGFMGHKHASKSLSFKFMFAALMSLLMGLLGGRILGAVSGLETLIMASLFVVALGIWNVFSARESLSTLLVTAAVSLIFFHGFAHGVEAQGSIIQFTFGMLISAAALMMLGRKVSSLMTHKWAAIGVVSTSAALALM